MATLSRWSSQHAPSGTTTNNKSEPPDAPVPRKVKPPAPVEEPPNSPPAPLPRVVKEGRRRRSQKAKDVRKKGSGSVARAFTFPIDLFDRLERFAVGHAERTATRFNYSAYVTAILDADLRKRGF